MVSTKRKIAKGNRQVLREIRKVEEPNQFDMRKMFEHTFGFKPELPIHIQKTKGGLVFLLQRSDMHKIDPAYTLGAYIARDAKSVKPRALKGKVVVVKSYGWKSTFDEETIEHEKAHLIGSYGRIPGKEFYKQIGKAIKGELWSALDRSRDNQTLLYFDIPHFFDSLRNTQEMKVSSRRMGEKDKIRVKSEKTKRAVELAESRVIKMAKEAIEAIKSAKERGIPEEEIGRIINKTDFEKIPDVLRKAH